MTAIWGPMGWMTLHSIALLYPDNPTNDERQMLQRFLQDFAESITCPQCEQHFKRMFDNYRRTHSNWSTSKFQVFLFVARVHNTVNKRLEKPTKKTVQECLDAFAQATQYTSASEFRQKYIDYVIKTMAREMSGDTMVKVGHGQSMRRVNQSYWNTKIQGDVSGFDLNADVLEPVSDNSSSQKFVFTGKAPVVIQGNMPSIGFKGGRLRLKTG